MRPCPTSRGSDPQGDRVVDDCRRCSDHDIAFIPHRPPAAAHAHCVDLRQIRRAVRSAFLLGAPEIEPRHASGATSATLELVDCQIRLRGVRPSMAVRTSSTGRRLPVVSLRPRKRSRCDGRNRQALLVQSERRVSLDRDRSLCAKPEADVDPLLVCRVPTESPSSYRTSTVGARPPRARCPVTCSPSADPRVAQLLELPDRVEHRRCGRKLLLAMPANDGRRYPDHSFLLKRWQ